MSTNKSICTHCGKEYDVCNNCEANGIFKWRLHYCSKNCFIKEMDGEIEIMRMQYDSKTYSVKKYSLKNGEFTLSTLDGEMVIKESDPLIQGYILTAEQFKEVKYGRFTKQKKVEQSDNERLELGEEE